MSKQIKLTQLWDAAMEAGKTVGGLEGWKDYCVTHIPFCTKGEKAIFTWKPAAEQPAPEVENGKDIQHFFHQVGRIPRHETANLLRTVQVAYNLGQLIREGKCTFPTYPGAYIEI